MATRRTLIKAVLAGTALAGLGGAASGQSRQLLLIQNRDDRKQTVTVRVDGRAWYGSQSERDEDDIRNEDGRATIRSRLDPDAYDSFYIDGSIRAIDWERSEPRMWLDGWRIDPRDYNDRDDDDDDDWSRPDRDRYPSRAQFVASRDDLEAVLRVSGRLSTGSNEIRVKLDRGETRSVFYSGNIRELRTANGSIDVHINQR